jgi:hypothetical protein
VSGVLVSQLARMGDLTQSLNLLEDLVQAEGHPVSVLVDKRLEAFVRARVPRLEAVYTVDLERYLQGFRDGRPWTGLWQTLADELRSLWGTEFERIINLNYGKLPGAVAREATREDVIGFLCRGCAGDYLLERRGRMPSLPTTLQLLLDHYRVNRSLLAEVGESLDFAVPETLPVRERERLKGILRKGWTQLKEMHDESVGEEPFRLGTATA